MSIPLFLTACVIGALMWLDRVYALQIMVSRPIIVGGVLGLVLGDLSVGLMVGLSLELLWLRDTPVGAVVPEDETFAAVVAMPVSVMLASQIGDAAGIGLALVCALPAARIGRTLDVFLRRKNEGTIPPAGAGLGLRVKHALRWSLLRAFGAALLVIAVFDALLLWGLPMIAPLISRQLLNIFAAVPFICLVVGLSGLAAWDRRHSIETGLVVLGMCGVMVLTWVF